MSSNSALLVICMSIALCTTTLGSPILDDLFKGYIRDSQLADQPAKDSTVVKRRIYEENPDAQLKQISLQSLIGDVENSLFQTALSVSSVANNNEHIVPEVRPQNSANRAIIKRQTAEKSAQKNAQFVTTTESNVDAERAKGVLLQTTQKVPAGNGIPAHILIDRVAIQPHQGGVPLIPTFQVSHTKLISTTFKEPSAGSDVGSANSGNNGGATKISIAQTAVQATNVNGQLPVITISTTNQNQNEKAKQTEGTVAVPVTTVSIQNTQQRTDQDSISTSPSASIITEQPTTKLPIVKLKEAEEELKEKVAEIEAEPVILTARV